jgi:hypothetical protein
MFSVFVIHSLKKNCWRTSLVTFSCTAFLLRRPGFAWFLCSSYGCRYCVIMCPIGMSECVSLTYGAEPFLRSRQLRSHSRTSQYFMEPKGSLPCSQEPATGPYPEPDWSSPYRPILCIVRPILILSTHLRLGLRSGLFPSGFSANILYAFIFAIIRATCPAHVIHLDLCHYFYVKEQLL